MRFRLSARPAIKIMFVVVFVMLVASLILAIFRIANLFGFVSMSIGLDVTTLVVTVFLMAVALAAALTTGYTLNENGVTFRLLFVKIFTPLDRVTAFEYSVKLKVACVYHIPAGDRDGQDVAQMVINIDPDKYEEFAKKLKQLRTDVIILPYDQLNDASNDKSE